MSLHFRLEINPTSQTTCALPSHRSTGLPTSPFQKALLSQVPVRWRLLGVSPRFPPVLRCCVCMHHRSTSCRGVPPDPPFTINIKSGGFGPALMSFLVTIYPRCIVIALAQLNQVLIVPSNNTALVSYHVGIDELCLGTATVS